MGYNSFYCKYVKVALDTIISVVFLALFWWLYVLIALAVKIDDPSGPAIFKQERLGKHGKVYWMYKFRSMRVGAEHTGSGVYSNDHDDRVTRVGRFLRKTSLDELPQLWNVICQQLAIVGPRSPLTYHPKRFDEYTSEQRHMFDVRPGITGWAQVHGRRTVEWNRRIEMNCWYADHVSLWLDIKILFMTVFKVLANKDNENIGETVGAGK